jgi:CHAT domain-containing protein
MAQYVLSPKVNAPRYLHGLLSAVMACFFVSAHAASGDSGATWENSIQHWSGAIEAYRTQGAPLQLGEALARRAEAYQALGHRQRALEDLEEAAPLVDETADARLNAAILGALGQANFLAGRIERAELMLAEALARAQRANAKAIASAVLNDQGILFAATGRMPEALAAYRSSAFTARAAEDALLAAKATLNAARLQSRRGERSFALILEGLADLKRLPDSRDKAFQLASAGDLLRQIAHKGGDSVPAEAAGDTLKEATEVAARSGESRGAANAWGHLAELAADDGRIAEALALNDRALFDAQRSGAPEIVFQWQWQRARLLERLGKEDDALTAYRRTLDTLDTVKSDLAADLWANRESFGDRVSPAYLGLADLLMRRAASSSDRGEARTLLREVQGVLERFKTVELEDYFRDDCVARYLARARPVEETAPRTAVIYPVPLADRLELLITLGAEIHQITIPAGTDVLAREALALRQQLERRATYQYLPHARRLYDWIIRPLEPLLARAGIDTLVLIPDRPLRGIPLGVLHDGQDFLVARYAVAIAPSLTLVEPRPLGQRVAKILSGGLTQAVQGYPALPYVDTELQYFKERGAATQLRDQSFTTQNLERELTDRSYSIVHVASHAKFDSDSRRSFLLTYDGKLTMDQLEKHMKLSRFREEPIELLSLSACQTAAGDERAALGLAGVAVKAGARSALATLWHVNDQASSLLVSEFYRQLGQAGTSKAQALQRAQRAMLSDFRYRHPGYWSPFLLIGNWL